MIITTDMNPTTDFTRVLNSVIFDERLSHAEFRMWCMLLALPKGQKATRVTADEIAAQTGLKPDICRLHRRNLKAKGFLVSKDGELVVTVPSADFEPAEPKLTPEQLLRRELRETWMSNRPDIYGRQKHPLTPAQVATLKLHAEHNGETDLCKFLAEVLKGCKVDPWWSAHGMNFNNIFGTGTPKQNKFTNVEKLFKLAGSNQGQAALFDKNDDQCWLDWYESKGHAMTKVVRLEMERWDAYDHETENPEEGTIFVYSHEDDLVHWSLKADRVGVSYLPTAG